MGDLDTRQIQAFHIYTLLLSRYYHHYGYHHKHYHTIFVPYYTTEIISVVDTYIKYSRKYIYIFLMGRKRFGDGCSESTQLSEEFSALSSKKCSRRTILTITNYERCYSIYLGTKRLARGSEQY